MWYCSFALAFCCRVCEHSCSIVFETFLDGVDVILVEDFRKERFAVIEYKPGVVHLKFAHSSHMITLTPPKPTGQLRAVAGPAPKVILHVQANRALRNGAQGFWEVVREGILPLLSSISGPLLSLPLFGRIPGRRRIP
jgi:hypothetical protein